MHYLVRVCFNLIFKKNSCLSFYSKILLTLVAMPNQYICSHSTLYRA